MRSFFIKKGTNNNSYQLISDDLDFVADRQDIQEKCPEGLTEVVLKSEYADACKWATDYENQVVDLKAEIAELKAIKEKK